MRFRDFLLHITYCLGIRVTLMLRGPSGLFYFIAVNLVHSLCLFLLCVSARAAFWRNKDW